MTAVTVSPLSFAALLAANHSSSGTRTVRFGVSGWLGTFGTLRPGVFAPSPESSLRAQRGDLCGSGPRDRWDGQERRRLWQKRASAPLLARARSPELLLQERLDLAPALDSHHDLTPVHPIIPSRATH